MSIITIFNINIIIIIYLIFIRIIYLLISVETSINGHHSATATIFCSNAWPSGRVSAELFGLVQLKTPQRFNE